MTPVVGVGAIVFDANHRVLLVERGRPPGQGLWSIPGGKLEPRETLAQAVAREVREETGLIVEVGTLACVLERFGDDYHFVLLDYHPFFLLSGIPTHFPNVDGEQIAIENTVHLTSDHVGAASQSGWALLEMHERLIDDEWIAALPNMARYARRPVSFVMVWQRRSSLVR